MKTFHLTVAKVGENLFDGEALSVTVPGSEGELTILAGHEAYVSPLTKGVVRIVNSQGEVTTLTLVDSGIVEVSANQTTVLL